MSGEVERRSTDWPLVVAIFVGGLLAAGQFAKVSLGLPQIGVAFDAPATRLAYLVSILGVVGIIGGAMAGGVVAAWGAARVLVWSMVLGGGLSLLQAFLPPLPVFAGLRVVEGLSHLGVVVSAPPLMAGLASDRDRPMVMSIWASFFGVAFAIGAVIFPWVLNQGGIALVLALHGIAMLVVAGLLVSRLQRQIRAPLRLDPWRVHARIYSRPDLFAPGLGFVFYTLTYVALLTLLPMRLGQPWLATGLPLLGLAGTFAAGPAMRRIAPPRVAACGFAAMAVLGVPLLLGWTLALLPLFLIMGIVPAASFAMIPYLNRGLPDRAQATGCIAQLGNVGTTLGTPFFAICLGVGGLGLLYLALIAVALAGLVTVLMLARLTTPA
ncbi:MFS transporter [Palleronia sp. LCG004]|uniref:MFS transporter n=1 Tax=Palleronia sp. LCG004 TaxID=3079304 RepID=UPI00294239C1|nr:MFS transporter [Palleronia sp. LCG004]WOI57147.1 MFS transporter [Palleronia sp. LCG004]